MGLKGELVKAYAVDHGRRAIARFALRLLGVDDNNIQFDEEVWRTNEEGRHFKFESTTGEIKGGFGGKFNGMKLGTSWRDGGSTVGPPKPPEKPKEPPKPPEPPKGPEGRTDDPEKPEWMKGLSSGKQAEAEAFMNKTKEAMADAQRQYEEIQEYFFNGADSEVIQRMLKSQGLENYNDYMTPEEFVMMCGRLPDRKKLTDLAAEAQGWPKKAKAMLDEKLSDDQKNILSYLQQTYGYDKNTGIPYDSELNSNRLLSWNRDDAEAWMSLKSLAVGGPGGMIPESVLRKAKVIGRGDNGEDYSWYVPTRRAMLERTMASILGDKAEDYHNYTLAEFQDMNQRFLDKLANGEAGSVEINSSVAYVMPQLRERMGFSFLTDEMIQRLNQDEKKRLMQIIEEYDGNQYGKPFDELMDEDFRRAEDNMWGSGSKTKADKKEKADYCLLMEKMLIGAEPSPEEERKAKLKKEKEEAKAKAQQEKAREEALKAERAEKRRQQMREAKASHGKVKAVIEQAISDASSTEDIETIFRDGGYFAPESKVSLSRVEFSCARDTVKSYEKVMDAFPFMYGQLGGIGTNVESLMSYAECFMYGGMVNVRSSQFSNPEFLAKSFDRDVASGFHPKGMQASAAECIVTHELGHALDGWLSRQGISGSKVGGADTSQFSGILRRRVLKSLKLTKADVSRECSGYASKDAHEWFAECFSEAMLSPNPRPMAAETMRQLKQILKEEGLSDD